MVQNRNMNAYIIGSGAVLTAGANTAMAATLHARTDPAIAVTVRAALVDFEGSVSGELSRIIILAAGFTSGRFDAEVAQPLARSGGSPLGEVLRVLGRATQAGELHVFARWLPEEALVATLQASGIEVIAHPLETISQAALICGRRYTQWRAPVLAA